MSDIPHHDANGANNGDGGVQVGVNGEQRSRTALYGCQLSTWII